MDGDGHEPLVAVLAALLTPQVSVAKARSPDTIARGSERLFHCDAVDRLDYANNLEQQPVPACADNATAVLLHQRVGRGPVRLEPGDVPSSLELIGRE